MVNALLIIGVTQANNQITVVFDETSKIRLSNSPNDQLVTNAIRAERISWTYLPDKADLRLGLESTYPNNSFWFRYTFSANFTVPASSCHSSGYQVTTNGTFKGVMIYDLDIFRSSKSFGLFEQNVEAKIETIPNSNWKRVRNLSFDVRFELVDGAYKGLFHKNIPPVNLVGEGNLKFKLHNFRLAPRSK